MNKIIEPGSFDFGVPMASLVDIHSKGVDSAWMTKRAAAAGVFEGINLTPKKDHSVVHLIAMGDAEYYGMNRNGDIFFKQGQMMDIPEPFDGVTRKVQIHCGNVDRHHTFEKYAHVYRNHKNKDPKKSQGDVLKSAHNDEMSRVELLVQLHNGKWATELHKLASGDPVEFSMACVTDPSYPVLTTGGYKPLVDVQRGDVVHTHKGNWKCVTGVNRRKYTGKVYTFEFNGLPLPLELTADHPMMSKLFSGSRTEGAMMAKSSRYFKNTAAFNQEPPGWAHAEHAQIGDRFLYQPVGRIPCFGKIDSIELASIMGYYTAEGSFVYNGEKACTTQFTCHLDDSLPRVLPALVEFLFPEIVCAIRPHHNSDVGLSVDISHTGFSEFLWKYVGRLSRRKYICPELFNAEAPCKLAFLGSWLEGDGWVDKKGGHWSSCNIGLILQGRDLLASLEVASSIYRIDHAKCDTSGYAGSEVEYTLNVSHLDLHVLRNWSDKVKSRNAAWIPTRTKPPALRLCPDGRSAYRIKSVTCRSVTNLKTYNIEVEGDNSYSLAGLISHNCRVPWDICTVCGHKAAKKEHYCSHAKDFMTQILKSGHQVGVANDFMTYFDISKVYVNADRIAYGLLKAAGVETGEVIPSAYLADDYTLFPPGDVDSNGLEGISNAEVKLAMLKKLSEIEKEIEASSYPGEQSQLGLPSDIPEDIMQELQGLVSADKSNLFGAMSDAQISLSLKDFLKLIMGNKFSNVEDHVEEAEGCLPGMFGRGMDGSMNQFMGDDVEMGGGLLPRSIRDIISGLIPSHSLAAEPARKRVSIMIIRGGKPESTQLVKPAGLNVDSGNSQVARRLAEAYGRYKLAFLQRNGNAENRTLTGLTVLQHYWS